MQKTDNKWKIYMQSRIVAWIVSQILKVVKKFINIKGIRTYYICVYLLITLQLLKGIK